MVFPITAVAAGPPPYAFVKSDLAQSTVNYGENSFIVSPPLIPFPIPKCLVLGDII